ncbi:VOC family protein [Sebaldella termitidis]|uniref:VOC family protein n=1 Tax=Sebaldella termitidis TaxID=826 RepID=UPI003EBD02EB
MMKIDNVTLKVKDIDKMTAFYEKVLGMKVRKRDSERTELGTDKDTLLILKTNEKLNYRKPETANLYHIAYLLPKRTDLAVFLRHIMDTGFDGLGAADHLVSEAIYLNDPENNGIEIYTDRNKEVWSYTNNGDVVMDTLSLNADELYYLSSNSNFRMPDGSRVGHVHMQGVNIPEIRKFYKDILLLNKTAVMPNAVFMSYDGYHHHFAFNHWDSRISKPGDNTSTGLEAIEYEVDKERYEHIKNNAEKNLKYPDLEIMDGYFTINDLNNVKLIINNKN